jgi:hypothetical protein
MKISDIVSDLPNVKLFEFQRTTNAFNFVFRKEIGAKEAIIVKMPPVSANKRGINDIGWIGCAVPDENGNVPDEAENPIIRIYGTLAENLRDGESLIQEIQENDEVNKTVSAIIVRNLSETHACTIEMRAIFN